MKDKTKAVALKGNEHPEYKNAYQLKGPKKWIVLTSIVLVVVALAAVGGWFLFFQKDVKKIEVVSTTHKVVYVVGEEIDVTNLKIEITNKDDTTEEKDVLAEWVTVIGGMSTAGEKTVKIKFGGVSTTYTITVNAS